VQDEVVTDKIKEDIQQGVRASAGRVAEGLNRHQLAEWGVKEIDELDDPLLYHKVGCLKARR
jgi:hypothetical protein